MRHLTSGEDRQAAILSAKNLVMSLARKHHARTNRRHELDDLEQYGWLAAIEIVDSKQMKVEPKTCAYFKQRIDKRILEFTQTHESFIRIPASTRPKIINYIKAKDWARKKLNREPTFADLAGVLNQSIEEVAELDGWLNSMRVSQYPNDGFINT